MVDLLVNGELVIRGFRNPLATEPTFFNVKLPKDAPVAKAMMKATGARGNPNIRVLQPDGTIRDFPAYALSEVRDGSGIVTPVDVVHMEAVRIEGTGEWLVSMTISPVCAPTFELGG